MDEVFGDENFCAIISFTKTSGLISKLLPSRCDFLLWFAKSINAVKFRPAFTSKSWDDGTADSYNWVELSNGIRRGLTSEERQDRTRLPKDSRIYRPSDLTSQGKPRFEFAFNGKPYAATWKTTTQGLERLGRARRLHVAANSLRYVRPLDDFPVMPATSFWDDTGTGSFTDDKLYVRLVRRQFSVAFKSQRTPATLSSTRPAVPAPPPPSPSSGAAAGSQLTLRGGAGAGPRPHHGRTLPVLPAGRFPRRPAQGSRNHPHRTKFAAGARQHPSWLRL